MIPQCISLVERTRLVQEKWNISLSSSPTLSHSANATEAEWKLITGTLLMIRTEPLVLQKNEDVTGSASTPKNNAINMLQYYQGLLKPDIFPIDDGGGATSCSYA